MGMVFQNIRLSENIKPTEKEGIEHYLGKNISKNEYNNLISNISNLSESINKNPNVLENIVSGLLSETENEKVKNQIGLGTNKKYYSQTADMEQKYLKYKNKYLSLKQKLSV